MRVKKYFPYWMNEDKTIKTAKEIKLVKTTEELK